MSMDRIEKRILLRAPRARVWRALADSREFGTWFGFRCEGPFVPGARLLGKIVPTTVDPVVGAAQKAHEGKAFEIAVERMEAERLFSFRWHPHAIDAASDYSAEPMTLVEFALEDADGGVMLTLVESGFEGIPAARREESFRANEGGWGMMANVIAAYVVQVP